MDTLRTQQGSWGWVKAGWVGQGEGGRAGGTAGQGKTERKGGQRELVRLDRVGRGRGGQGIVHGQTDHRNRSIHAVDDILLEQRFQVCDVFGPRRIALSSLSRVAVLVQSSSTTWTRTKRTRTSRTASLNRSPSSRYVCNVSASPQVPVQVSR